MLSVVTRLRNVWGGLALLVFATVAMYVLNPFHVTSRDPRARIYGVMLFRAPSHSMEPTVKEGAYFFVNFATLRSRDPHVGEIVVFRYPPNPDVMYLKRVVATGGMTIEMRHGVVYLDGKELAEPYLPAKPVTEMIHDGRRIPLDPNDIFYELAPTRVPAGHFFMLGDNRGNSADSRQWGFVPRELVVGSYMSFLRQ